MTSGASVTQLAAASAKATEQSLEHFRNEPALSRAFWLLTQLPLAARQADFEAALKALGLDAGPSPALADIVGAVAAAVDKHASDTMTASDASELALQAATEALSASVGGDLPSLLPPEPADVKFALGRFASKDRFASLAREFFARLVRRLFLYFLSRELPNHVGPRKPIRSVTEQAEFEAALDLHCREASRIIGTFAGGWYSKTNFEGGISETKAKAFAAVALRKLIAELQKRSQANA